MVERRGHRHGHTDEYKQLSVKVHVDTYGKLKNTIDKTDRNLSNISAVVETACKYYLDDKEAICWKCGKSIKADYTVCPYCGESILFDKNRDRRKFEELYKQQHPEYRDTEKYRYLLNLTLIEMRKVFEGDFNFVPERCERKVIEEINARNALIEYTHKTAGYDRLRSNLRKIRQKNKE